MKIAKILHNNVVTVIDENESVVMARGLGFKKQAGDVLDPTLVEKVFKLKSEKLSARFSELLSEIPLEVVTTATRLLRWPSHVCRGSCRTVFTSR